MIKKFIVVFSLLFAAPAFADDTSEAAVRATVQKYIDGYGSGNVDLLKEVFHPDVVIKYADLRSGEYRTLNMDQLNKFIGNVPETWSVDPKFHSLDIHGTIASAKISLAIQGGALTWTDYISLLKYDGKWMIVSKISHGDLKSR